MLQSKQVYLAVSNVSTHLGDSGRSAGDVGDMNSRCVDVSFEQLLIHLAQLQRMLVSAVVILNSYVLIE